MCSDFNDEVMKNFEKEVDAYLIYDKVIEKEMTRWERFLHTFGLYSPKCPECGRNTTKEFAHFTILRTCEKCKILIRSEERIPLSLR